MTGKRKTTASVSSVGADGKQPIMKNHTEIIANETAKNNLQATDFCGFDTNNCKSPEKSGCSLQTISMTELYDTLYPPRSPVVDGFLYGGTYLFVGAPKVGKSFFMGQLAYHIAMGIPLWDYPVRKGTVLYLALEDDYARLQRRLSQMFGIESADNLYFATQAKTLKEGLDGELEEFVKQHTDARLIIIDTLQKVREVGGETFSYSNDYEIVTKLKAFSDKYGICLLVVHHTRKMESGDSFDMISGTNGLLGAADGAFIMQKKKRTDNTAVLDIVGRDQPDQELTIEFDRERCIWKFKKAETELWKQPPNPLLEAINEFLAEGRPEWEGTATELLKQLPDMQLSANVLSRRLNVVNSQLLNDYGIFYDNKRGHERRIILKRLERNE
ncbi:AAA family ATPase [Acetatifactor aquisgranensis]|uniref:AAA family ATPase n=1 Tax=Acetatifactor aquisgranensis TaxID=2941233 RepID=UPI00203B5DA4|nr:helicase RepA family protein [Acetatifactor aquisgranensis]